MRFQTFSSLLRRSAVRRGRCLAGVCATTAILAGLIGSAEAAPPPTSCDLQLTIELTPDVPEPTDAGFLSSLVGNHPGYTLRLRQQLDDTTDIAELSGPGPDDLCRNVVESMRKDGRVLHIQVR